MGRSDKPGDRPSGSTDPGAPQANGKDEATLGYKRTPLGYQWLPRSERQHAVDKSLWRECDHCHHSIPVAHREDGRWAYVCPVCAHARVADPVNDEFGFSRQRKCLNCRTELGGAAQCPRCSFPRGWMAVPCFHCHHPQPVELPHMAFGCDVFTLECVRCELISTSLCIC